jgi:hypothetical protein
MADRRLCPFLDAKNALFRPIADIGAGQRAAAAFSNAGCAERVNPVTSIPRFLWMAVDNYGEVVGRNGLNRLFVSLGSAA